MVNLYRKDGCCNEKEVTSYARSFQIFKFPDILMVIIVLLKLIEMQTERLSQRDHLSEKSKDIVRVC